MVCAINDETAASCRNDGKHVFKIKVIKEKDLRSYNNDVQPRFSHLQEIYIIGYVNAKADNYILRCIQLTNFKVFQFADFS